MPTGFWTRMMTSLSGTLLWLQASRFVTTRLCGGLGAIISRISPRISSIRRSRSQSKAPHPIMCSNAASVSFSGRGAPLPFAVSGFCFLTVGCLSLSVILLFYAIEYMRECQSHPPNRPWWRILILVCHKCGGGGSDEAREEPRSATDLPDEPEQERHWQEPVGQAEDEGRAPREAQAATIGGPADSLIRRQQVAAVEIFCAGQNQFGDRAAISDRHVRPLASCWAYWVSRISHDQRARSAVAAGVPPGSSHALKGIGEWSIT